MAKKKRKGGDLTADVQDIIDAINGVFGDTSVSKQTTLEYMEEIQTAVEVNIDALSEEIKKEERD